ncbi:MAG: DUF1573 domain-containing protein [Kiritimatiellaeota bacterium]|nr:DUF1573 domain-containing protein [Kiritimatiellota bacterium]
MNRLLQIENRIIFALCCLLVSVLSAFAAPRVSCENARHTFDTMDDDMKVAHTFTLRNTGDEPLVFGDVRLCCGGTAVIADTTLAPGAATTIATVLSLQGRSGPLDKSFYVASNDPLRPFTRLRFTGRVNPKLTVSPASVTLRTANADDEPSAMISVRARPGIPLPADAVPDAQWLRASLSRTDATSMQITITVPPPLRKGVSRTTVRLSFPDASQAPVEIPVTLAVPQEVTALPAELVLSHDPTDASADTRHILLRSSDGKPFRIVRVESPHDAWRAESQQSAPDIWRIKMTNLLSGMPPTDAEVRVVTDHPDCPEIAIPVNTTE